MSHFREGQDFSSIIRTINFYIHEYLSEKFELLEIKVGPKANTTRSPFLGISQ